MAARLAAHWTEAGNRVSLVTLDSPAHDQYAVPDAVHRIGLDLMKPSCCLPAAVLANARRVAAIRRTIRGSDADVVVSLTDKMNITTLAAMRGMKRRVVIGERSDPRYQKLSLVWERLRRWLYKRCDAIIVQTEAVAQWARQLVPPEKVHTIPNPAPLAGDLSEADPVKEDNVRQIVYLGRLSPEKGCDLLLRAFAAVAGRFPKWRLVIYGQGPCRDEWESLARESGIADRVDWRGWTDAPSKALAEAALFVLPSRYEGFPNVLLEAMAMGLPCVSFDCPSGPREVIRPGVDGVLVEKENVDGLANSMAKLMADPIQRERLGKEARSVSRRFAETTIFRQWDEVIESLF